MAAELPQRIVFYDGVCGFCHASVQWLLAHDSGHHLFYAPLQGPTAVALRADHPEIPTDLSTIAFVEDGRVYLRSKAFLHLARHLDRPWRAAYHLRWLPAPLLDLGYRLIASVRYRLFGKHEHCEIPRTGQRAQLLP